MNVCQESSLFQVQQMTGIIFAVYNIYQNQAEKLNSYLTLSTPHFVPSKAAVRLV